MNFLSHANANILLSQCEIELLQAQDAMNGVLIGKYEVKVSFLFLFPSDRLVKARVGEDLDEKYSSMDIQLALRSLYR